jgi:hypothetical protein
MEQLMNHFLDEFRAGSMPRVVSAIHEAAEQLAEFHPSAAENVLAWLAARRRQEPAR